MPFKNYENAPGIFGAKVNSLAAALTVSALCFAGTHAVAMDKRSYVIEWFSQASHSTDGDCPAGINPPTRQQYYESFELLGFEPEEVEEQMKKYAQGGMPAANAKNILRMRGRIDGEPVNGFVHPWTVADPNLNSVKSDYALGFNLDGQVSDASFTEPMTNEKGIDNQLFRAMGCIEQFRGTYDHPPTFWAFIWGSMKETTPAWLMTVEGKDLGSDGPVTITFDRALEHITFGPTGNAVSHITYRADPDPRSHHEFAGKIENNVLSITDPGELRLLLDTLSFPEFVLFNAHLRMTIEADGSLKGLIGGYQPLWDYYFGIAQGGLAYEGMIINDAPGIYHSLKRHADGNPDPETGEFTSISAAYRIDAVPAFVVPAEAAAYQNISSR